MNAIDPKGLPASSTASKPKQDPHITYGISPIYYLILPFLQQIENALALGQERKI
jgi:hypothetical protein